MRVRQANTDLVCGLALLRLGQHLSLWPLYYIHRTATEAKGFCQRNWSWLNFRNFSLPLCAEIFVSDSYIFPAKLPTAEEKPAYSIGLHTVFIAIEYALQAILTSNPLTLGHLIPSSEIYKLELSNMFDSLHCFFCPCCGLTFLISSPNSTCLGSVSGHI